MRTTLYRYSRSEKFMLNFLFLLLLCRTAIEDWYTKTFNFIHLSSIFTLICLFHPQNTIMILIYVMCLYINHIFKEKFIGHGDIDILWLGYTLLTPEKWLFWLLIACVLQLCLQFTTPKHPQTLPFVPALACSWLLILATIK